MSDEDAARLQLECEANLQSIREMVNAHEPSTDAFNLTGLEALLERGEQLHFWLQLMYGRSPYR